MFLKLPLRLVSINQLSVKRKRFPEQYPAEEAQKSYANLAKQKGRKTACTPELKKEIETFLKAS